MTNSKLKTAFRWRNRYYVSENVTKIASQNFSIWAHSNQTFLAT